jgi:hypothetical protein
MESDRESLKVKGFERVSYPESLQDSVLYSLCKLQLTSYCFTIIILPFYNLLDLTDPSSLYITIPESSSLSHLEKMVSRRATRSNDHPTTSFETDDNSVAPPTEPVSSVLPTVQPRIVEEMSSTPPRVSPAPSTANLQAMRERIKQLEYQQQQR